MSSVFESHRNIINKGEKIHPVFKQLHKHFLKVPSPDLLKKEKAKIPISQSLHRLDLVHTFPAAAKGSGF